MYDPDDYDGQGKSRQQESDDSRYALGLAFVLGAIMLALISGLVLWWWV